MKHEVVILEDDNYDLNDDIAPEYDFSQRDRERERRFRGYALERLPGNPARLAQLNANPGRAVKLLRWALDEAAFDARLLPLALRAVITARGSLEGLDLSREELGAMMLALDQYLGAQLLPVAQVAQAA